MHSTQCRQARRGGWVLLLLLCLFVWPVSASTTQKKVKKPTEFGTGVETGFGLARYHDTCIMFRVFFISDEFFVDLRKVGRAAGHQFRKGSQTYSNFPNELTVNVEATAYRCSGISERPLPPDFGSGILNALTFKPQWKREAETRPAEASSVKLQHTGPGLRWDYFLAIRADEVPLTDEIIIDVNSRGASFTRLLAGLSRIASKE